MLRKGLSRWTSRQEETSHSHHAFSEMFWIQYVESLSKKNHKENSNVLPVNTKKYSPNSSAVAQVRGLYPGELPVPSTTQIIAALKSPFSGGDVIKAFYLLRFFQLSDFGFFITNDGVERNGSVIKLQGAENWENVMCYMDSLLFSMFANLESFEPILFVLNQNPNPYVAHLLGLLRMYVNLLRLGNIITTDITQRICECLNELGFSEALSHRQQDCAPLFEFLTETLAMPLLTFRVEIQHSGKHDDDDERYSKERILFVSVPEEDDHTHGSNESNILAESHESAESTENHTHGDEPITLEECLEHYFNNSISVERELQRRATLDSTWAGEHIPLPEGLESTKNVSPQDINGTSDNASKINDSQTNSKLTGPRVRVRTRSSTLSVWSISSLESKPRQVMLPAWMLLRLLPFYTDDNDSTGGKESFAPNSKEFANRRPVLPICLKRYSYSSSLKRASRSRRRIIIPPVIDLPLFVADDNTQKHADSGAGYKLILESAVCHRGTSIESGHFVSAVRKNAHVENETLEQSLNASWYQYNDTKKPRVEIKTFKEIFDHEWPYMLFYRLVSSDCLNVPKSLSPSPMIAPRGSKMRYWEDTSSPKVLEPTHTLTEETEELLERLEMVENGGKSDSPAHLRESTEHSESSAYQRENIEYAVPIPHNIPGNSKFLDIRKRYLWYVTDKEKNYYKESAIGSKNGSSMSICFTPQFRRNSQWSSISNISGLELEEEAVEKVEKESDSKQELEESVDLPHKKDHRPRLHRSKSGEPSKKPWKKHEEKKEKCVVM